MAGWLAGWMDLPGPFMPCPHNPGTSPCPICPQIQAPSSAILATFFLRSRRSVAILKILPKSEEPQKYITGIKFGQPSCFQKPLDPPMTPADASFTPSPIPRGRLTAVSVVTKQPTSVTCQMGRRTDKCSGLNPALGDHSNAFLCRQSCWTN